jgi:hypothetical protein
MVVKSWTVSPKVFPAVLVSRSRRAGSGEGDLAGTGANIAAAAAVPVNAVATLKDFLIAFLLAGSCFSHV